MKIILAFLFFLSLTSAATIYDYINSTATLSTLKGYVDGSGLAVALQNPNPTPGAGGKYTFFCYFK